jgi:hypothetical protein
MRPVIRRHRRAATTCRLAVSRTISAGQLGAGSIDIASAILVYRHQQAGTRLAPAIGRSRAYFTPRHRSRDNVRRKDVDKTLQITGFDRRWNAPSASRVGRQPRGRRAATCDRARCAICRTAAALLSRASAISSYSAQHLAQWEHRTLGRREVSGRKHCH